MNRRNWKSPLELQLPWISLGALRFLDKVIKSNMKIFEYGSGGSTLYFSNRCHCVVSVEHDFKWFDHLKNSILTENVTNVDLNFIPPFKGKRNSLIKFESQRFSELIGYDFLNYVTFINGFQDEYFDIVLIDGRVRVACFENCLIKTKKGGYIVLDNSERIEYENIFHKYNSWVVFKYYGPVVQELVFSETTIFRKPIN